MSEVLACQSDYLASDDFKGRVVTVEIAGVSIPPDIPGGSKGRKSKSILIRFAKGSKEWIVNPTNQWSLAVLLGTKVAREWIGKRVSLHADKDVDIDARADCMTIRVHSSPDATPDRAEAYRRAWDAGPRERGALCRRLKRIYRLSVPTTVEKEEKTEASHEEKAE